MTGSFWAAPALAVVAGLLLLLSSAAGWVDGVDARDVGGVVVREPTSTSGTVFAPTGVAFGLGGLLGGVLLGVLRAAPRRAAGAGLTVGALAALGLLAVGLGRANGADGAVTPAPLFALASAVGLAGAGWFAVRGPARPPVASRYRVEGEQPADDEWSTAVEGDTDN